MEKKKIIYTICLIIYLIVVIGTEILYRKKLYNISLDYQENIKQSGFLHYFYFFWSYIFIYGMICIGVLVVLVLYPYNVFLCLVTIVIFLLFIMFLLKSIYVNSRPYWEIYNERIKNTDFSSKPTECDGEFGNPSGHSLLATTFLDLWYLFINSNFLKKFGKKCQIFLKIVSFVIVIACILLVMYSRIHRQIHGFNQVMLGFLLGLAVFFAFCIIIEFDKIEPENFFSFIYKFKYIIIPILLILFAISVTLGYTRHNKYEEEYRQVLEEYCKFGEKPSFGKSTAYHSGIIFILIGGYLGILFLIYKINQKHKNEKEMFYNWNNGSTLSIIKIIIFAFILPAIPVPVIFVFPYEQFTLKFILEVVVYFWYGLMGLGLCFYYGCVEFNSKNFDYSNNNNISNNNITNINNDNSNINSNNNNSFGSNRNIVVNVG
jgi:membrane-associated phospholipid phosphatase